MPVVEVPAAEVFAVEAPAAEAPAQEQPAQAQQEAHPVASGDLPIGLRALIDAGVHFGHQTRRWNPKMRPFIFGARNGIHIIDLDQTAVRFKHAYEFVVQAVARGGHVLFVGTKRQAVDVIREEADRAGQFYVTGRWLGGTLTNFRTVKNAIERLRELERMFEDGSAEALLKKEQMRLHRERERLEKFIGGIKMMNTLPSVLFVIDPHHEHIAVREARKLHIPIVAITDTNCDPDLIDFVVPGNDDAIRSIKLFTSRVADACVEGQQRRRDYAQQGYAVQAPTGEGVQVEYQRGRRRGGGRRR
ncbi:MAG TPA: 30S ribosomal protein S2 [Sandaracinaceae bacterium LLY-WYZ-13_1]|nr:30S ribosomal protein S2 [Sandaracinaceae bacterium LLY-WYZ-13_1]